MRLFAALVVVLALAALTAVGGVHLALHALPLVALTVLLLNGLFVGEERILAVHRARAALRRRPAPERRWQADRPSPVASLLARSPRTLRGPPVALAL